jgi:hypothetical protein
MATVASARRNTWGFAMFVASLILAVSPVVLSYRPYSLAWDDTYYFHRGLSLSRAIWDLSPREFSETFSILMKSPLMALMTVPWGPVAGSSDYGVGMSLVSLGCLTWVFILLCIYVLARLECPWAATFAAALSVGLNPFMRGYAGAFVVDGLLAWIVLLLLLLIPYEASGRGASFAADLSRGALWGFTLTAGALAKVTFGFFALFAVPCLIYFRLKNSGVLRTVVTVGICCLVCVPAAGIWFLYGRQFLAQAWGSSGGDIAKYYSDGLTTLGFLASYARAMGAGAYLHAALIVWTVWILSRSKELSAPALYATAILVGFFLVATRSRARDLRYFMPVMVAFPFLLSVVPRRKPQGMWIAGHGNVLTAAFASLLLVSFPAVARPDLADAHYAAEILMRCRSDGLKRFTLATDSPAMNSETFLLAKELLGPRGKDLIFTTLAYDAMHHRSLEASFQTIESSDVVAFEEPTPRYPAFTNDRVADYLAYAANHGAKLGSGGGPLILYRMKP